MGTHFLYQWVGQSASGWLQLAYQSLIPFVSIAPQMLLGFVAAGVLFGMVVALSSSADIAEYDAGKRPLYTHYVKGDFLF